MDARDAAVLREQWGDKPCDHPSFSGEYAGRAGNTGDFHCNTCGEVFDKGEKQLIEFDRSLEATKAQLGPGQILGVSPPGAQGLHPLVRVEATFHGLSVTYRGPNGHNVTYVGGPVRVEPMTCPPGFQPG